MQTEQQAALEACQEQGAREGVAAPRCPGKKGLQGPQRAQLRSWDLQDKLAFSG